MTLQQSLKVKWWWVHKVNMMEDLRNTCMRSAVLINQTDLNEASKLLMGYARYVTKYKYQILDCYSTG